MSISVITPTIPPRADLLARAVASVVHQTISPASHIIEWDLNHEGPAVTRNRAIQKADTEWLAFLDDDDAWYPYHLEQCLAHANETGADLIYPIWKYGHLSDPLGLFCRDFDPDELRERNYIPICTLVRTEWVRKVGGFPTGDDIPRINWQPCEDWGLWLRLLDAGCRFEPLWQVTWQYSVHGKNLSGRTWK